MFRNLLGTSFEPTLVSPADGVGLTAGSFHVWPADGLIDGPGHYIQLPGVLLDVLADDCCVSSDFDSLASRTPHQPYMGIHIAHINSSLRLAPSNASAFL